MSTVQENLTYILKTSDYTVNSFVKSDLSNFVAAELRDIDGSCEKNNNCKENFKKFCFSEVKNLPANLHTPSKLSDLIVAAEYLSTLKKSPCEAIISDNGTFGNELINLESTALKEENLLSEERTDFNQSPKICLKTRETISERLISEFLKSLCSLCDICNDRSIERVVKLNRQERIVAAVILKKRSDLGINTKKIIPTKIPKQSCSRCFTNIILLYNRYKQRKIKEETPQIMDQSSHGYQCQCLTCQNKYGALAVLVKGIEQQSVRMQSSQIQTNSPPEHNVLNQGLVNFQPFTHNMVLYENQPQQEQNTLKYYETYMNSQPHLQSHVNTPQSHDQSYPYFQTMQTQRNAQFHTTNKTEIYLDQTGADFPETRRITGSQDQFDVGVPGHSDYYDSGVFVNYDQIHDGSSTLTNEEHLPTLLKELEEKCQTDVASQPSTSSAATSQIQDEKLSKKFMTCEHCEKKFTHKGDFNKHLRKHTKEKPYKCSFCDKMFSHTSNLHRHERIHSGDRPFRCQYCDKCFNRKDKLESHKNSRFCKNRRNWK